MKCYFVFVHGSLDWIAAAPAPVDDGEPFQPQGFYCHRYVLASTSHKAQEIAFRRVLDNLDSQTGWITARSVNLELEAEETSPAPLYRLLRRENRGHTFYNED